MAYTRQDIIEKCNEALRTPETFYQAPIINYRGRTTDTNELYNEIVAQFVCERLTEFVGGIRKITREETAARECGGYFLKRNKYVSHCRIGKP